MHEDVVVAVSSKSDGTMKVVAGESQAMVDENRHIFLSRHNISMQDTALVRLDYDSEDFCRYAVVGENDRGEGMVRSGRVADGLVTGTPGLALFLPLADCIGAVLYDPDKKVLMLSHLGRHNLEQFGGKKSVEFMMRECGVSSADLRVWLGPAAGRANYPLYAFGNRSLHEVAIEQLCAAGVAREAIVVDERDTASDETLFSHSQFLKGETAKGGRFAVAAMIR